MVREAIAWLDRTLPLAARFPKGSIFREDRLPVPADALREVIINAVIHRDVSRAASYVAIAVFDDRIEVRSVGDFPTGIRAELLSKAHPSILRNPLIAGAFHRTGAVEVWGRGTNRVIEVCRAYGIAPPEFTDEAGVVTVTCKAAVLPDVTDAGPSRSQVGACRIFAGSRRVRGQARGGDRGGRRRAACAPTAATTASAARTASRTARRSR
jgi:ATP-dependent DNA helicase RecG